MPHRMIVTLKSGLAVTSGVTTEENALADHESLLDHIDTGKKTLWRNPRVPVAIHPDQYASSGVGPAPRRAKKQPPATDIEEKPPLEPGDFGGPDPVLTGSDQ